MREIDYIEIGNRIRMARENKNLTQERASELCEITPAFYGNIERGDRKMSVETLFKISVGLGVSVDYLFFGESVQIDKLAAMLKEIQKKADKKQFEKYIIILQTLASIVDQL